MAFFKFFFLLIPALLFATSSKHAVQVLPDNPVIEYIGRWDKTDPSNYHSYWGGAYLRLKFTGSAIKIKLMGVATLSVSIDGKTYSKYTKVSGLVDLSADKTLSHGIHEILIAANYVNDEIQFGGLELEPGAEVSPPERRSKLVEYIGDSITSGSRTENGNIDAYGWLLSESLDWNHTQISYPGITLVDGYGYSKPPMTGQERRYFSPKPTATASSNWDFSTYIPNAIVVNLGTNDYPNKVPSNKFESVYKQFLSEIRERFPKATIIVLRTFSGRYAQETMQAVNELKASGDTNLHYVDTEGWLTDVVDFEDKIHPNEAGHRKVAAKLNPILQSCLKSY